MGVGPAGVGGASRAAGPARAAEAVGADEGVRIAAGTTWSLSPGAADRLGIGGVAQDHEGRWVATIAVLPNAAPGGWESQQVVAAGDLLPTADGVLRIVSVRPPDPAASLAPGGPGHGGVTIGARTVAAVAAHPGERTVFLSQGGELRLGAQDPLQALVVRVAAWAPDAARPDSATLEWMPSYLAAQTAALSDIGRATVSAGGQVRIGGHVLVVRAMPGHAPDHAAWVELRLMPTPPGPR